jgi:polysaccharide biosynthesis/export protein
MKKRRVVFPPIAMLLIVPAFLTGCASSLQDGMVKEIASPVVEKQMVRLPPEESDQGLSFAYEVGPGDYLSVNVSGRPEFEGIAPEAAGTGVGQSAGRVIGQGAGSPRERGFRVDAYGNVYLPIVGAVKVGGLSIEQIQRALTDIYKKYIVDPWVIVDIAEYRSRPIYLLGQFALPGTYYMDRPYHILEALSISKGLTSKANLRGARLIRNKRLVPVDIYSLLMEGDTRQNILLKPADTIYIPDKADQNVLVFGAVKSQGTIPMNNGKLTLLQALALAGLGETSYDRNARIIRSFSATRGELIVVDIEKILRGESGPFPLMDGDVVYVPKSPIANWNQALNEILPTFQAFGAVLTPFVQMKYLTNTTVGY